jgi:hypothetical protein
MEPCSLPGTTIAASKAISNAVVDGTLAWNATAEDY